MKAQIIELADYNRWANARQYADAATLPHATLRQDVKIYFRSIYATLAHLLNADRAWLFLLEDGALADMRLPEPPVEFDRLRIARQEQDDHFVDRLAQKDRTWFDQPFVFTSGLGSLAGRTYRGTRASALMHVFNHQTHHRGQVHAALTILGIAEPRPLDILVKGFADD